MEMQTESAITDTNGQPVNGPDGGSDQVATASSQLPSLDSMEKFVFEGKEYTPQELKNYMLRQQDYTRKTQEIAKERDYIRNLRADLDHVRQNPNLVNSFKSIYPKEYHQYLDLVLKQDQDAMSDEGSDLDVLPKHVQEKLKKIDQLERKLGQIDETISQKELRAAETHLDTVFQKMGDKYPYAVEDSVMNAAQAMIEAHKDDPSWEMTDKEWDRLFKLSNDKFKAKFEKRYKGDLEAQLKTSQRLGDTASGGQAPGRAPVGARTIAEATELAIQDMQRGGLR